MTVMYDGDREEGSPMRTRIKIEDLSVDQVEWLTKALPGYFPETDSPMVTIEFLEASTQELVGARTMPVRAFMKLIDALAAIEGGRENRGQAVCGRHGPVEGDLDEHLAKYDVDPKLVVDKAREMVGRGEKFLEGAQNVIDNDKIDANDTALHAGSLANLATAQFSGASALLGIDISDRWYQR